MNRPAATVYVPTLAGGETLAACLDSLLAQTVPVMVVVADNGAGDGCLDLLEARFPGVTRIANGRNLGFGAALNRAIRESGVGPVVLLNDDAVADPRFVEQLLSKSGPAQMVAAVMVRADDPEIIDSAGVIVDQTLMAFDYLSGGSTDALDSVPSPLGPTGGGALYDRTMFEQVGGFDENIFLYYEDVDLALRIRAAGGRCELAPAARASHGYSQTLGARSAAKYRMTGWSRGYMLRRYGIDRHPGLMAGALVRELAICAGQLVADRTLAGLTGRIQGFRAAANHGRLRIPPTAAESMSAFSALKLRRQRHSG
ncbi:MAG: glycosyltransferase family 2 protein [Solirubrobacterales bacterium]